MRVVGEIVPHGIEDRGIMGLYIGAFLMGLGPKGHPTFVEERGLGQSRTGLRARRRRRRPSDRIGSGRAGPELNPSFFEVETSIHFLLFENSSITHSHLCDNSRS